ncbi:uncharacterized protein [Henckelia pumila]|uniref:uncharacterized protein isoform X2 n=1 Tax=Henckelia pumila TaxID=405737 RepID=UPI003C6DD270
MKDTFATNPKLGTKEFKDYICRKFKCRVSKKVAYIAKLKALKLLQGSHEEQFSKIRNYCAEFKRSDEGATIILKLNEDDEGVSRFQRLYICFTACRVGFKDFCRRVIGVDGCFLKGKYGGQLLTAVGLDPNSNIFPLCYALVERDNDSWTWFLKLLDDDIGPLNEDSWTFMSDKQKGLIPAFEDLFLYAAHQFCVRHLHSNMKHDGFKSLSIKNALWAAAKATRIEEFHRRMQVLKAIEPAAYECLGKKPENHWTRSHFSTVSKTDILTNNMCEIFNSMILDSREMPIIQMFESIRNMLMNRFVMNREKAKKWNSEICPKIRDLLVQNSKLDAGYSPMMSYEMHFQIMNMSEQHSVDLSTRSCSCRKWDLTGIPCKHAICAIWYKKEDPGACIHPHYMTNTYNRCYAMSIMPVNGQDLWPDCDFTPPLPPVYTEKIGRPAKLRRREPDEPPPASKNKQAQKKARKLNGAKRSTSCRKCGKPGHNQRSCKVNVEVQQPMETQQSTALAEETTTATTMPTKKDLVNESVDIQKPAFVKGGRNFTTVARLRAYKNAISGMGQSSSSPMHLSQESVKKK